MQDIVKKNKRLSKSGKHQAGPLSGTKSTAYSLKKKSTLSPDSDEEIIKELMGSKFHY